MEKNLILDLIMAHLDQIWVRKIFLGKFTSTHS